MKRFSRQAIIYTVIVAGFCLFIAALQTWDEHSKTTTQTQLAPLTPPPAKIWTEADFQQAEAHVDEFDLVYGTCDKQTGDCPPMLTADDVHHINAHHKARMNKLIAGVK